MGATADLNPENRKSKRHRTGGISSAVVDVGSEIGEAVLDSAVDSAVSNFFDSWFDRSSDDFNKQAPGKGLEATADLNPENRKSKRHRNGGISSVLVDAGSEIGEAVLDSAVDSAVTNFLNSWFGRSSDDFNKQD